MNKKIIAAVLVVLLILVVISRCPRNEGSPVATPATEVDTGQVENPQESAEDKEEVVKDEEEPTILESDGDLEIVIPDEMLQDGE